MIWSRGIDDRARHRFSTGSFFYQPLIAVCRESCKMTFAMDGPQGRPAGKRVVGQKIIIPAAVEAPDPAAVKEPALVL